MYQAVVALVPNCGTSNTKLWYFEYQPLAFHIFLGEENHIFTYLCQSIKHGNKWKALKNKINIQPHCGGSTTRVEQNTASNLPYRLLTVAAVRGRNRRDYLLPGGKLDDTGRNRTRHPAAVHPSDKVPQQPVPPQRLSGKESRGEPAGVGRAGLRYVLLRCRRGVCRPRPPVCLRSGRIRHTFIVPVRQPHLHRTGKRLLANWLGQHLEKKEDILERQAAVRELAPELQFRQHFRILGMLHKGTAADETELKAWAASPGVFRKNKFLRLLPATVTGINGICLLLMLTGYLPASMWGVIWTLFVTAGFAFTGKITKIQAVYGKKLQILGTYAGLLKLMETQPMQCNLLKRIKEEIGGEQRKASLAISRLSKLMNELDQRNNVFMYVILNGLFFGNCDR